MSEQVLIAGSGPAGLTAAIYLARADRAPLVIDGDMPGGQLMTTTMVENYPGFGEGVMGPDLVEEMRNQAERFGARFERGTVNEVDFSGRSFTVTGDKGDHECDAVIVAAGASARLLGLESERALMGHGVSTCATCDASFFRDKTVIVVGGGDSAMEESTFLTKFAEKVYVVHRRDELRASKAMQQKAFDNDKIAFIWNTVVADIMDPDAERVTGVKLHNRETDETREMDIDGVFLAIGHEPNTAFLAGAVEMDEKGYIVCREDLCRTSVAGVFACGDVVDYRYRQVATAVGMGCRAALDCETYLSERA